MYNFYRSKYTFSYSEEFKFDVTDFTYKTSKIISNIKGPSKNPTNKIIMSSLEGDVVSGNENLINIEFKYREILFFEFEIQN